MSSELQIDFDDLTIEEIEEVETRTGIAISDLIDLDPKSKQGLSAKALHAFAYIISRRGDPDFTWEQAGKLKLSFLSALVPEPNGNGTPANRAARRARPTKAANG